MIKNTAGQKIGAQMITAADGTIFTGAVTVYVTGDAGTQALGSVGSGVCVNEGNGYSTYAPAQAETNYSLVAFTFIGTGAISTTVQVFTQIVQQTVDNDTKLSTLITGVDLNADAIKAVSYDESTAFPLTAVNGSTLTEAGGTGDHLTAINLPNQTMDIVGDITGNLSGSVGSVTAAVTTDAASRTASQADVSTLATTASLDSAKGAGFVTGTDSLEAIRDRGDAAWTTGAGGSAPTVEEIADGVWDELISGHTGATTFGGKNQKVVPSETVGDYKADVSDIPTNSEFNARSLPSADYTIVSDLGTVQTADHTAAIADIPTVAEFNARTIVSADYVVVGDTIAGVTLVDTTTNLTNAATNGDLTATMKTSVNAEVDTALNTAIPGSPTAKSINDYIVLSKYAVCNRWDITEASGNLDVYDDDNTLHQATAAAFTTLAGVTLRKKIL